MVKGAPSLSRFSRQGGDFDFVYPAGAYSELVTVSTYDLNCDWTSGVIILSRGGRMTLYRAVFLFAFALTSTCVSAADPNSTAATSSAPASVALDSIHLVPWFTGANRTDPQPDSAASTNEVSCLALRTYKVKRSERLTANESALRGYTTCQLVSNYQIRTAVG